MAALPQIRVDGLTGSQPYRDIQIKITIYFYKIIFFYEKYSTLNLYSCKNKLKYILLFTKQELDMPIGCHANIKIIIVYKAILFSSVH